MLAVPLDHPTATFGAFNHDRDPRYARDEPELETGA
jgi:hypothetical protein